MVKKEYFRYPKITKALEVTKSDLLELIEKFSYISISEADKNNIEKLSENEVVGAIFGDIDNILQAKGINVENETTANPDCWFVFRPESHGYKDLLDNEYKFGDAIELLKLGYKVARKGWNGKGMWLILQPATPEVEIREGSVYKKAGLDRVKIDAHIDMYTAQGTMQPGWLASQADMLAEDWYIVN